jgi:hypothetical protein
MAAVDGPRAVAFPLRPRDPNYDMILEKFELAKQRHGARILEVRPLS